MEKKSQRLKGVTSQSTGGGAKLSTTWGSGGRANRKNFKRKKKEARGGGPKALHVGARGKKKEGMSQRTVLGQCQKKSRASKLLLRTGRGVSLNGQAGGGKRGRRGPKGKKTHNIRQESTQKQEGGEKKLQEVLERGGGQGWGRKRHKEDKRKTNWRSKKKS